LKKCQTESGKRRRREEGRDSECCQTLDETEAFVD